MLRVQPNIAAPEREGSGLASEGPSWGECLKARVCPADWVRCRCPTALSEGRGLCVPRQQEPTGSRCPSRGQPGSDRGAGCVTAVAVLAGRRGSLTDSGGLLGEAGVGPMGAAAV